MIRTAIVDDEPLARQWIRILAEKDPAVRVVAEYEDGRTAVAGLRHEPVDLLFLDVQMPELDGFHVLRELSGEPLPLVVFVTAFDQYAIRAFEVAALDYLLKPFDEPRFRQCLTRVKRQLASGRKDLDARLEALLADVVTTNRRPERIAVRSSGRVSLVALGDIDWIEANDDAVVLHAGRQTHTANETLTSLERRLEGTPFLRIHRSVIVNSERIREIQPLFRGEHVVILHDGRKFTVGRKYRASLERLLGEAL